MKNNPLFALHVEKKGKKGVWKFDLKKKKKTTRIWVKYLWTVKNLRVKGCDHTVWMDAEINLARQKLNILLPDIGYGGDFQGEVP